ncbi:MAG: HAMP domain-containing histidine kinase [Ruminococcaceae bacterium]|nr:HAMP domain-containing histidine kinase [Oscillospiraceae bacterium]
MSENLNAAEKKRLPLSHSGILKALAFILAVVMLFVLAASALGAVFMIGYEVYSTPKEEFLEELNWGEVFSDTQNIAWYVGCGEYQEAVDTVMTGSNIIAADIVCAGVQNWTWSHGDMAQAGHVYEYAWNYSVAEGGLAIPGYNSRAENTMLVRLLIAEKPEALDMYWLAYWISELAYGMMYAVYPVALLSLVFEILCLVFLMRAAGRRPQKPGITPSWASAIPSDLLTAALVGLEILLIALLVHLSYEEEFLLVFALPVAAAMAALLVAWLMSLALRIKLGTLWRNTLVFRLLKLCWRAVKAIWRGVKKLFGYFMNLRFFWQAGLVFGGIAILELFFILITGYTPDAEVLLWILEMIVLLAGLIYFCLMLRELRRCGKAVAEGDMSFEPDTRFMPRAFREHAEDLKGISQIVNKAVEQRMVSERMKTELITNVSHDLKTPLTSLINYSDFICRESCDNPNHREYADVLHRQSEKMKRLIDDLVEASKASSGNLDINLAPCAVDVLLAQAAAEYEQRLSEAGLTPVFAAPKQFVKIMADGRRLWRVVDNLMNNICKYALCGTRVYLSAESKGGEAVISFKNTSREQLNLSPEELMERFVRGDSSRGGEGSGLGLSIARSLTELQGGKMEIICDGDLFKVQLKFPCIE